MVDPIEGEELDPDNPPVYGWRDAPVSGERVDLHEGPIIAGDPAGARVEVTETGLRAYDSTGTETASIAGEGGEFVGGSFRTSDALPGQVTLADDAYVTHLDGGGTFPGIKVVPIDTTNMQLPAGIGPSVNGLTIFGGRNTAGGSSIVQANPTESFMRTFRDDNRTAGEIQTSATESFMRTFRDGGGMGGEIQASPTESFIRTFGADGVSRGVVETAPTYSLMITRAEDGVARGLLYSDTSKAEMRVVKSNNYNSSRITADGGTITLFAEQNGQRYLKINETGIWIESGGKAYNLDPQQTSNPFPVPSGWAVDGSNDAQYTITLGVCHWDGVLKHTGTLSAGWSTIGYAPVEARPSKGDQLRALPTASGRTVLGKISAATGKIEIWVDKAASGIFMHFSPFTYLV